MYVVTTGSGYDTPPVPPLVALGNSNICANAFKPLNVPLLLVAYLLVLTSFCTVSHVFEAKHFETVKVIKELYSAVFYAYFTRYW